MALLYCMVFATTVSLAVGSTVPTTTAKTDHDCMLPTVPGMCKGYFPRFSYHPDTKTCTQFIYGGCGGNANNFLTLEECNKACVPQSINHQSSVCSQPTVGGMCDAYFPRFSYHTDTNQCTQFIYGGCGGNQNNFQTLDECNKACVNP